jgi:hypothetical protein
VRAGEQTVSAEDDAALDQRLTPKTTNKPCNRTHCRVVTSRLFRRPFLRRGIKMAAAAAAAAAAAVAVAASRVVRQSTEVL